MNVLQSQKYFLQFLFSESFLTNKRFLVLHLYKKTLWKKSVSRLVEEVYQMYSMNIQLDRYFYVN